MGAHRQAGGRRARSTLLVLGADPRHYPPLIPNINGFTEPEEWVRSHALLEPLADAIQMSSLCPNLAYKGPTMHDPDRFAGLLRQLGPQKHKPLIVKLRNYWNDEERANRLELARVAADSGVVDGLVMSGMVSVPAPELSQGKGGLSGVYPRRSSITGCVPRPASDKLNVPERQRATAYIPRY